MVVSALNTWNTVGSRVCGSLFPRLVRTIRILLYSTPGVLDCHSRDRSCEGLGPPVDSARLVAGFWSKLRSSGRQCECGYE